jgi:hypothetical protein
MLTACSGGSKSPGVAHVSSSQAVPAARTGAFAFAECMRRHGVPGFPDPGGSFGSLPPKPEIERGTEACRSLLPQGQSGQASTADKASFLEYSACVRAHGVPNFPDPIFPPGGGMMIGLPAGVSDSSPAFQAAQKACQARLPGGGPKGPAHGG